MQALVTRLTPDGSREKVLVHDWPQPEPLSGNQVLSRTSHTGITNGTERNDLLGGNYATPNEELPGSWGYQNVGQVTQIGPDVTDLVVAGRDKVQYTFNLGQRRRITMRQDSHFYRDDLHNVCHLVDRGRLAVAPLVKDVVPVVEADRIYATLRDRPNELMGTVFVW